MAAGSASPRPLFAKQHRAGALDAVPVYHCHSSTSLPPPTTPLYHRYVDGGVASYLPVVYEVQRVYTTGATMAGFFTLRLDRSGVNVWGGVNTSVSISVTATDVAVKSALEGMPNVGKVRGARE